MYWAVKNGYGYKQFSRLLKPIFLKQAEKHLIQQERSLTDSALALVSGLHRGDVQKWQQHNPNDATTPDNEPSHEIPLSSQVMANWVIAALPPAIPYKAGPATAQTAETTDKPQPITFCDLVQRTPKVASQGFSAQLILQDMVDRGLVTEQNGTVELTTQTATNLNTPADDQAMQHLCLAHRDLLATGLHNLQSPVHNKFLEESIEVDGLHPQSVHAFHDLAQKQWRTALAQLLPLARQLSDHDEPQGGQQRLRLGIYFYTEQTPMDARVREHDSQALDARVREHDGTTRAPPLPSCPAPTGHPSPTGHSPPTGQNNNPDTPSKPSG